ncbi:MAG: PD40 domain-containing protein [Saprospiraceae bacterium]|nr:PD40 domain-containing protein [Saprospiraceae bacterium]
MRIFILLFIFCMFFLNQSDAQVSAALMRYPDVSDKQILFTYANDLWTIPKAGGLATRLTSLPGVESYARFSPDGSKIAFTANYDGNYDVYVMPVNGGIPRRLTSHGYSDKVIDWTNDGEKIVFASARESGKMRFNQFYQVSDTGGVAEKMPFAYAENGSFSPDGRYLAVNILSQASRTWKRYKGGMKGNIHIYDLQENTSHRITPLEGGSEEFPMWNGNYLYFITDNGPEERMNIWRYDPTTKQFIQLTHHKNLDIKTPALGNGQIVYLLGSELHLFTISSGKDQIIPFDIISDQSNLKPKTESVADYIMDINISPDGQRAVVNARGDLFSLPAKDGFVENLTNTSGIAERSPSWSPDGKLIAYWSDRSGEYQLCIKDLTQNGKETTLTNYGPGFRYALTWSPDSKKLGFIDQTGQIRIFDKDSRQTTDVDHIWASTTEGTFRSFVGEWSADSRYYTYSKDLPNSHQAIFIFDYTNKTAHQVTDGFYSCNNPSFDPDGRFLTFTTNQAFSPSYSDLDNTFVYNNSTQVGVITLQKDSSALLEVKNDTVTFKKDAAPVNTSKDKKSSGKKVKKSSEKDLSETDKKSKDIRIDFDGMEKRMEILPIEPGNINGVQMAKGKIFYMRMPNTGAVGDAAIKFFDIEDRKEKTVIENASGFILSADRNKMLLQKDGKYYIIDPKENAKPENPLRTGEMMATIDPKKEWHQMVVEVWRLQRDYFYDKNMHGIDWDAVKTKYLKILENANTRQDVNDIIGDIIGELNASHTYVSGGDMERSKSQNTGYLGINWQPDGRYYKVGHIVRGADWDSEVRSPLDLPGVKIKEGDYILAVNGIPITTQQEPFAAFAGLAGKTIELTYNSKPDMAGAKKEVVTAMDDEYRLRNLEWIENMRKYVDESTNGEVGYIYVPSTGLDGQRELMRMFNAQTDKKALIIDERFNNGGQIPDRFIEMLDRKPLVYWATRDGHPWKWPPAGQFGPKVMLINGWSGSGGDAFPDYFRKRNLGPIIGTRTWGGLIGISGVPQLIDGGNVTVPTFRMYNLDGTWFKEGHGVDPDIVVQEDLGAMYAGRDVQLIRAVEEAQKLLKTNEFHVPQRPPAEKR